MSFRWAPPLAWNHHMTLCTQPRLCALTGEEGESSPEPERARERRSLINDHMLREISSRQIRWLSSTWRKSTGAVRRLWDVHIFVYFFFVVTDENRLKLQAQVRNNLTTAVYQYTKVFFLPTSSTLQVITGYYVCVLETSWESWEGEGNSINIYK